MVIPSETEEHTGEIWDPIDGMQEIKIANEVIQTFISDMDSSKIPRVTTEEIRNAADVLGLYAGYPREAADMESYIKSSEGLSYREVVSVLKKFTTNMNVLIEQRLTHGKNRQSKIHDKRESEEETYVPF